ALVCSKGSTGTHPPTHRPAPPRGGNSSFVPLAATRRHRQPVPNGAARTWNRARRATLAADARPPWPKPLRNFARASSLAHLQVIDFFSRWHMLADVVAIIGSLDILFPEMDR